MKFKFSFQKLLEHRKREEEIAMRDYILARTAHDEAVDTLERYYQSVLETRTQTLEIQCRGGPSCSEQLRQLDLFIEGQHIRVARQKLEIRTLGQEMEERQALQVTTAQASRALEKLKEKLKERHRIAKNKKDIKDMDDLITMRFRGSEER